MAAVQANKLDCLEVREAGRALKVQSDNPHLVSIGSGRLSTNVTWHPLPEGKVTVGCHPSADVVVQGTGVEPSHCIIENSANVVTIYPLAQMTTIDGLPLTVPTRLSQGNMICIGRSNYLRFNHPAEANLMKKFLPNTRISMAAPLNFFGNGDPPYERKPPVAPHQRRSRDSPGDGRTLPPEDDPSPSSKAPKYEYLSDCQNQNKISPKVFPAGSTTVNSPASAVFGHSRIPNGLLNAAKGSQFRGRTENGTLDYIEAPVPQTIASYPQKATISYSPPHLQTIPNGYGNPLFAGYSCDGRHHGGCIDDSFSGKSPAPKLNPVNWNSSPHSPDTLRSVTPNMFPSKASTPSSNSTSLRSITPSPCRSWPHPKDVDLMSRSCDSSLPSCLGFYHNADFTARKDELEQKMLQAQEERKREEEAQLLEKQRLDEILTMCAEYERQAQYERQTKLPTTPTLQQNRIKTNGSLPRDKRSNGLPSPMANSNSEDELNQIFTFDSKSLPRSKVQSSDGLRMGNNRIKLENPLTSRSPYENLSKVYKVESSENVSPDTYDVTSVVNKHVYLENTLVIKPQGSSADGEEPCLQAQSPRTRIRTTVRDQSPKDQSDVINELAILCDYDTVDPVRLRNASPGIERRRYLTPSQQLNEFNDLNSLVTASQGEGTGSSRPVNGETDLNELLKRLEMEFSNALPDFRISYKGSDSSGASETKKEDFSGSDEFNNDLPESERHINEKRVVEETRKGESTGSAADTPGSLTIEEAADKKEPENFMRQKKKDDTVGRLKVGKTTLLNIIARLKSEVQGIEQQEEEILREVKMEAALLNAEYMAQKEKHKAMQDKLNCLRDRQKQLDAEIEQCKTRDSELQQNCNARIEDLKREIDNAEASLGAHKEFSEDYKNLLEKLEAEKKSFEDLEFKQLEEEANWLATKDDLQREIFDTSLRLETRKTRLTELESQIQELEKSSQVESGMLETQKIKLLQQLEEARTKLKDLDVRLSSEHDSGQDNSEGDESYASRKGRPKSKQSQEDLVRISKVTSDAPIDIGKTGSLGRKTVESLKEIERIRQIHLAKQGSQVIEEERKRVEQLKRRVQDEVRAQWEQTRQRECNSLNSVGSEESSLTCSDQPTECASSDDVDKALTPISAQILPGMNDQDISSEKLRGNGQDGDFRNSRPISDYSCSDVEQSVIVKKRDLKPTHLLQQRPLTRYLPIRSETLNLRQHVESAGHQVDLCPHVTIDATSCRGILHKLGGKFHNWNKRWFVFDRTERTLVYYADKTEKKQRGGTYFQAIKEVYLDHLNSVKSPHPHLTFVIKTHERTYHLMAPSPEAMRIWMDVIFTGAEGHQEFEHGS